MSQAGENQPMVVKDVYVGKTDIKVYIERANASLDQLGEVLVQAYGTQLARAITIAEEVKRCHAGEDVHQLTTIAMKDRSPKYAKGKKGNNQVATIEILLSKTPIAESTAGYQAPMTTHEAETTVLPSLHTSEDEPRAYNPRRKKKSPKKVSPETTVGDEVVAPGISSEEIKEAEIKPKAKRGRKSKKKILKQTKGDDQETSSDNKETEDKNKGRTQRRIEEPAHEVVADVSESADE